MKVKHKFKKVVALIVSLAILLPVLSTLGIVASAEDVTSKFTYQYLNNGTWKSFNGKIEGTANIDGLRIQNNGISDFYIQYRTQNAGVSGFYSYVKSNISSASEYAGSSGKAMQKLQLQAYNNC